MQNKLVNWLQDIGRRSIESISRLGSASLFLWHTFVVLACLRREFPLLITQIYAVGVLSAQLIVVSGLTVGMVLALQGYYTLVDFGAEESLGQMVALSLVREMGPVLTALLFAGRAGSALTAEIGLMKVTEQISAMEIMAVDPYKKVIAPRFVAGVLSMPLLAALFSAAGVFGGYLVGVGLLGVDAGAFWSQMSSKVDLYDDIYNGVVKSMIFGLVATWIAVYEGFYAVPTTEGVSRATTRTVVHAAFAVLGLDFILTALMFGGA
ncbi:MAG TPA: lipid asymmetry maintenance ABC transporter permease subunit MlaE [Gammaproteobacteria bacterium]|nr:lipid asymmetry maintenance ABC transporter permease subunit MlaE [Gammaproteobacteria bacterium]